MRMNRMNEVRGAFMVRMDRVPGFAGASERHRIDQQDRRGNQDQQQSDRLPAAARLELQAERKRDNEHSALSRSIPSFQNASVTDGDILHLRQSERRGAVKHVPCGCHDTLTK